MRGFYPRSGGPSSGWLLTIAIWLCSAPPASAEDLLTVYRQAAETSPVLAQARALFRADQALRPLAMSGLLPKLQANAGVSRGGTHITGFGAEEIEESYYGSDYSVTLKQPILDGQAWASLRAADAQIRAGEAVVLAAEQDLILEVAQAYFQALSARAERQVALSQRDLLQAIFEQTEAFLKAGTGDIIARDEARARLDAAEAALIQAENLEKRRMQQIERLMHRPPGELDDLEILTAEGPCPPEPAPWVETAEENQPRLIRAREQLRSAEDEVEIARRARWPNLDLETGYSYAKGAFLPDLERRELQIGLVFTMPIYQGGEISAKILQARERSVATRCQLEDLEDQVRFDTEDAFLVLEDSVAQVEATRQSLVSAETATKATRRGYEVGTRTLIDLLNAVQSEALAQRSLFLARYTHVAARLGLKAAAGVLSVEDLKAVNALLKSAEADGQP
jgi:outer membrane protein